MKRGEGGGGHIAEVLRRVPSSHYIDQNGPLDLLICQIILNPNFKFKLQFEFEFQILSSRISKSPDITSKVKNMMMTSSNGNISALLALCAGNSPVTGEFLSQMPMAQSFDVFLDLRLNKRLSKQWWGWWFGTLSRSLWRHCNVLFGPMLLTNQQLV